MRVITIKRDFTLSIDKDFEMNVQDKCDARNVARRTYDCFGRVSGWEIAAWSMF